LIIYRLFKLFILPKDKIFFSFTISSLSLPITQSQLDRPFPGSINPKFLLESCSKSFVMAKNKNKKKTNTDAVLTLS